jgi:hypothetical protein
MHNCRVTVIPILLRLTFRSVLIIFLSINLSETVYYILLVDHLILQQYQ